MESTLKTLKQYDQLDLECDGLSRVLSYVLSVAGIEHTVMVGPIQDTKTNNAFSLHYWIVLPDGRYIDYRARMWLGKHKHIPHGIFNPDDYSVTYAGTPVVFDGLEVIAPLLMEVGKIKADALKQMKIDRRKIIRDKD